MMPDREKVIKGLEILMNGCEYIQCEDCCFYISTKPFRCGLREEQIKEDALALLKEQQEQIDRLIEENASNAEMAEGLKELLKEQDCNCCGTVFDVAYKAGKADAVVRCRDCDNQECVGRGNRIVCGITGEDHLPDWFCADGEAKG